MIQELLNPAVWMFLLLPIGISFLILKTKEIFAILGAMLFGLFFIALASHLDQFGTGVLFSLVVTCFWIPIYAYLKKFRIVKNLRDNYPKKGKLIDFALGLISLPLLFLLISLLASVFAFFWFPND